MNQTEIENEIEKRIGLLEKHIELIKSHPIPNQYRLFAYAIEIKALKRGLLAMRTI